MIDLMKSLVTLERTQVASAEMDIPDGKDPVEYAMKHLHELDVSEASWETMHDSYDVITIEGPEGAAVN